MSEIKLTVHPFKMDTLKEAAKKVQEEAGEAFAEYVILQEQKDRSTASLADEIADTIQAACNLAARYNIDLQAAMERCERRNRGRGRYEDAKPCGICDGHDCNHGGSCCNVSLGAGVLREKSPEEMSIEELFETLKATNSFDCRKIICDDLCDSYDTCETCRNHLIDLLKAAYDREGLRRDEFYLVKECTERDKKIEGLNRKIADLINERDGMKRRLEELSDAGITELHRLLRETVGEAKNITDAARIYVENARKSRKPDPEREAVIERLRGYNVYMTEPPSKNANRLFACITGNKDAEIACGNDIEDVRDRLIELLSYEKVPDGE